MMFAHQELTNFVMDFPGLAVQSGHFPCVFTNTCIFCSVFETPSLKCVCPRLSRNKDKSHSVLDIRVMKIRKRSDIFPFSWRLRSRSISVRRTTICLRIIPLLFFTATSHFLSLPFSSCVLSVPHSGFT